MAKGAHFNPKPAPEGLISGRLERVRERFEVPSVRAFWVAIVGLHTNEAGADAYTWEHSKRRGYPRVSYEAARTYHYDRDPPVEYLVRVSGVYGVRLEWLAGFDQGEMTDGDERLRMAEEGLMPSPEEQPLDFIQARIDVVFPEYEDLAADCQALVIVATHRFVRAAQAGLGTVEPDVFNIFLCMLRQTIISPLCSWYGPEGFDPKEEHQRDTIRAMLSAYISSIPGRLTRAPSHFHVELSWLPETPEPETTGGDHG